MSGAISEPAPTGIPFYSNNRSGTPPKSVQQVPRFSMGGLNNKANGATTINKQRLDVGRVTRRVLLRLFKGIEVRTINRSVFLAVSLVAGSKGLRKSHFQPTTLEYFLNSFN